ncbi:MAG: hypothetical protein RIF39_05790 [Cyclobacteriaceae bacterium]
MIRFVLVGVMISCASSVFAIANADSTVVKKKKVYYYAQLTSGTLIGCSSCDKTEFSLTMSLLQGVRIANALRIGAGFGLDSYRDWKMTTAIVSADWDIVPNKSTPFVQVNYGIGLKAWRHFPVEYWNNDALVDTKAGYSFHPKIGYRFYSGDWSVAFALGWQRQIISDYYEYPNGYWNGSQYISSEVSRVTTRNQLNRMTFGITVGWR